VRHLVEQLEGRVKVARVLRETRLAQDALDVFRKRGEYPGVDTLRLTRVPLLLHQQPGVVEDGHLVRAHPSSGRVEGGESLLVAALGLVVSAQLEGQRAQVVVDLGRHVRGLLQNDFQHALVGLVRQRGLVALRGLLKKRTT
jgi:hypothetical protein